MAAIRSSRVACPSAGSRSSRRLTAISLATSPARCPPIPSATTNSPSPAWWLSSFWARSCPAWVTAAHLNVAITAVPSLRLEHRVADLQAVADLDRAPLVDAGAVEVRAVAGRKIVDDHAPLGERDPGVVPGEVGVVDDRDRVVRFAPDRDLALDRIRSTALVLRFEHHQPGGYAAATLHRLELASVGRQTGHRCRH